MNKPSFENHFSRQAKEYARYRPSYPSSLFDFLASVAPGKDLAWDCGTGNGQAAIALARHFQHVVATDASTDQLAHARAHPRIEYRLEQAESVSLERNSVDLVTVAVAVHWFDLEEFYREVRRVLKPGGVLAVWTYHLPRIDPDMDRLLKKYYSEVLEGYWPDRFRYVDERYRTLPFPFPEIQAREFTMDANWSIDHLVGFLDSWSATRKYMDRNGYHPLQVIWEELASAWGDINRQRKVRWPLFFRIGRMEQLDLGSPHTIA